MILAQRLTIPDSTAAILWDMDGVLLDTLTFDYDLCNQLLQRTVGPEVRLTRSAIRENFPYALPDFWSRLLESSGMGVPAERRATMIIELVAAHEKARRTTAFPLNPGIREVLEAARERGLKQAVVSNNPVEEVREMLRLAGILSNFDHVVGNDMEGAARKPAPDCFLIAAAKLGCPPEQCVVVEDSLLGAKAGRRAGCYTVGVATGACEFSSLASSSYVDVCCLALFENRLRLESGNVTRKHIVTPNDFVSHMVEHIAWRMGCSIDLQWNNADWLALGRYVGREVARFPRHRDAAAVLGMIDDGSAEVELSSAKRGELALGSTSQVDLDWFLSLRCEQVSSGAPLVELLRGLAEGCGTRIKVTICNLEDPHHTWEGVFRSVGSALNQMHFPTPSCDLSEDHEPGPPPVDRDWGWRVTRRSAFEAEVVRQTAESRVRVLVDCSRPGHGKYLFEVSESVHVNALGDLLEIFARAAGLRLEVDFEATRLSSSHVAIEDTGMVLGRALKILVLRMERFGINGAGSSIAGMDDIQQAPVRVGVSMEGRKFLRFVPFSVDFPTFQREFLIGHTVAGELFSEDLDDFLDGLAGGLTASILVHVKDRLLAPEGWPLMFEALGRAVAGALAPNPARKGVPPGVKATLA